MRTLAMHTITTAAIACGLPAASVYAELENAKKESIFLPAQRMEIQMLDETLTKQGWRVARVAAPAPVCRTRYAQYQCMQRVRVLVRANNQNWLDAFCRNLLKALPSTIRDAAGNPVRIAAQKAVRQGYTFASIRITEACTQALHINFTGIIHKDEDTGFITNITIHPHYEVYHGKN